MTDKMCRITLQKNRFVVYALIFLGLFLLLCTTHAQAATEGPNATGFILNSVKTEVAGDSLTIMLIGDSTPSFVTKELHDPSYRVILDISNLQFAEGLDPDALIESNQYASLQVTTKKDSVNSRTVRFIFSIKDGYKADLSKEGNSISLTVLPSSDAASSGENGGYALQGSSDEKIRQLIEDSASQQGGSTNGVSSGGMSDSLGFSGYKQQKISVNFYKVDLHNVFRLFREISGMNLIVDEGVKGTLTLALKDVPWDFALDIILNLTDLEKKEKFNTIVIYPKKKEFVWPSNAADTLSVKPDFDIQQQESMVIEQAASQPENVMQAKDIMRKALKKEKNGDYQEAVALYEKACSLWPKNDELATRLSAIYLVHLGMNAKALYYAKEGIAASGNKNAKAALYAGIASANMQDVPAAVQYFTQSISDTPPMKEALASFAAFSETQQRYDSALNLYEKYEKYYGASVNTLVAKARIYDLLGKSALADKQYEQLLTSGFRIQNSLKKFAEKRLAKTAQ